MGSGVYPPLAAPEATRVQRRPWLRSVQSDRRRNSEKANFEYRIMNVECRRNVFCLFYKRSSEAIPSFDIRYSIFDILRFCGSLLTWCSFIRASPLAASVKSNQKRNYIFVINGVVSYESSIFTNLGEGYGVGSSLIL